MKQCAIRKNDVKQELQARWQIEADVPRPSYRQIGHPPSRYPISSVSHQVKEHGDLASRMSWSEKRG